jgi:drug/metabolite transporter (DMT)-like permease
MDRRPALLALLAAALFGAATPASKALLDALPPLELAALLYLGAALGVAPLALRGGGRLALPRDRANRARLAGAIAVGGVAAPVLLLLGLRVAGAAPVSLWLNLELVATAVLGALCFRDPLGRAGWLGVACALAAGVVLAAPGGSAGLAGLFVAAACIGWALDNHWTALLDGVPVVASTFWKGLVAGATNLALAAAFGPLAGDPAAIGGALGVGALSYGASIALYVSAAHALGATRAQLAFASAPVFGFALAVLWLGEPFGVRELAAAALFAAAVALVLRDRHAHAHRHEALAHTHAHRHDDGHHLHAHPGQPASLRHTHWHEHAPQTHAHPHWPDLHHRHRHDH